MSEVGCGEWPFEVFVAIVWNGEFFEQGLLLKTRAYDGLELRLIPLELFTAVPRINPPVVKPFNVFYVKRIFGR